ncbi:MAG: hypothetical protein P8Q97_06280 [Myxococcota bacterium]|nr:hypothetical protein [Myxococcota bacterium]
MTPDQASRAVVVNERTTVAMALATAHFLDQGDLSGPSRGVQSAAHIAGIPVDPAKGLTADRLHNSPNGDETRTEKTFNSLANLMSLCVSSQSECDAPFFAANSSYLGAFDQATDTLQALLDIALHPRINLG